MIQTSENYRPFPTVRSPDALISFEVIPKALIKENITAETTASAKMGAVKRTVNGVAELAGKYGTLERYGWKLDGTYSLIPSSGAETGFWTSALSDIEGVFDNPIKFRYEWDDPIDTFGWTFHFDAPAAVRASQVRAEWFDANGNTLGGIEGHTEGSPKRIHMNVTAAIEAVQEGSGDPSPSNVRPINGWTGATVKWQGGNLYTADGALEGYAISIGGDIVQTQGYLVTDFIDVFNYRSIIVRAYQGPEPWMTQYYRANLYGADKTLLGQAEGTVVAKDEWLVWEFDTDGAAYVRFSCPSDFGSTAEESVLAATRTFETDFPASVGTVYGGTYNTNTGVLTVTMGSIKVSDVNWSKTTVGSSYVFSCTALSDKAFNYNFICDTYKNARVGRSSLQEGECGLYNSSTVMNRICVKDTRYSTAAEFKTAMGDVRFVYELETPITYQLTPTDIWTTVSGGFVWADCGPVTVETAPADDTVITSDEYGGWSLQKFAENYTAVEFTFYGMNEPLRMLRLVEVDFGISRRFSADSVTDMRIVYGASIDASAFPAKELTFTFDNSRGEFNILSPAGVYQYWKNGQVLRAKVKIGDELVNMGMFTESTAEIGKNRLLVKVRAHDQCYHMDRQKYYPDAAMKAASSVTLKTAVEDVLAGYDLKINYNGLENELVSCQVNENHPKRAMIRYLAQAARCSVWIDRENTLQFKRFVQPTPDDAVAAITADELYDWSGVSISEEFSGCVLTVERELEEVDPGVEGTSVGVSYTYTSGESEDTGTNTASYENPCIAPGKEQDVCDWLLTAANWRKKYAVKNRCDPAVEIGDALVIEDAFHNDDAAIVTGLDVTFDGVLSAVTEAAGMIGGGTAGTAESLVVGSGTADHMILGA